MQDTPILKEFCFSKSFSEVCGYIFLLLHDNNVIDVQVQLKYEYI